MKIPIHKNNKKRIKMDVQGLTPDKKNLNKKFKGGGGCGVYLPTRKPFLNSVSVNKR